MNRNIKRNMMGILTAALLLTVLAACEAAGGGGGGAAQGDFVRTSWSDPFPEMITVTVPVNEIPSAVFAEGEDFHDNLWTRRWREEYNINMEVVWVSSDYELSMNLAIAAGDLPDMFTVNAVQFSQLLEANLAEDITDVVNNYGSPALGRQLRDESAIFETAQRNGRTYALPHLHWGFITQAPFMWVRKDWYEQAGSPEIRTVADVEMLMDTFSRDNGATLGTTLHNELFSFFVSSPMWHATARGGGNGNVFWVDDGAGGLMAGYELPEMLDALAAWRRWYEMGKIREDFATLEWETMNAAVVNGDTGILFSMNWAAWGWQNVVENFGPDSYMLALPLPTVDGRPVSIPVNFANYGYNVVLRGFEHPEIMPILVSDYLYIINEAPLTGSIPSEELLLFSTNEMHHVMGPFRMTVPHYHDVIDVYNAMSAHERGETHEFTSGGFAVTFFDEVQQWTEHGNIVGLGRYAQMGHHFASLVVGVRYVENGQMLYTGAWGADPQDLLDLRSITDSIILEGAVRIIMGLDPLEHWDTILEDWRQAGGNTMTQAVNQYFGN